MQKLQAQKAPISQPVNVRNQQPPVKSVVTQIQEISKKISEYQRPIQQKEGSSFSRFNI